MNIANLLMEGVKEHGNHTAIQFGGQTITYDDLNRKVNGLAFGLIRLGVEPGDVCVLMMPNAIEWVVAYFALAKVGAIVLPVNFLYREGELAHIFKDSGARVFIGHSDYLEHPCAVMRDLPGMDLRIVLGAAEKEGFVTLEELLASKYDREFPVYPVKDEDIWAIIYTSGTTGLPKGAMLSHGNLTSNAMTVADLRITDPNDVVLCVLPFYHIYGQTCVLNASFYPGLTIRLWKQFDDKELFDAIETEKSSILIAVPTILNRLLAMADRNPPESVRFAVLHLGLSLSSRGYSFTVSRNIPDGHL